MSEFMQIYPWQHSMWNVLMSYHQNNNVPPALIFNGCEGIGKFTLACVFAKTLLCTQLKKKACLTCQSCRLFVTNNHPDFYNIAPEEGCDVIKIDQIRMLIEQLSQTPKISMRQVVIIRFAERMNASAANALLKTLEEAPGNVIFLLICSKLHQLPATIRSRCQSQFCTMTNHEMGLKWLLAQIPNEVTAKLLWHISDQSPLLARDLFESDYLKVRDIILQNMEDVSRKDKIPLDSAKELSSFNIILILKAWSSLMLDLWQIKREINEDYYVNYDRIGALEKLARGVQRQAIERFYMRLIEVTGAESEGINLNKALLLDNLWIQFAHTIAVVNAK